MLNDYEIKDFKVRFNIEIPENPYCQALKFQCIYFPTVNSILPYLHPHFN